MKNYFLCIAAAFLVLTFGCKSIARFPIDDPTIQNLNDGIIGKWKFQEDTDKNNFYEILRGGSYASDKYLVKFWDRGGTNPTYESNMHFSRVDGTLFLNVPYFEKGFSRKGYFFLKVLDVNGDFTKMTTATVHDTTLWDLDQESVRQRITKNLNNPAYYYDTVHFYKVR